MQRLRALILRRQGWLALLLACTLAVRLAVPTGFMPGIDQGRLTLQLCSGMAAPIAAAPHAATMPAMHHGQRDERTHDKAETPCAFAGIGLAALGSVDPALLLAAILFAFLLAVRALPRAGPAAPSRLRPPLRAPPLPA